MCAGAFYAVFDLVKITAINEYIYVLQKLLVVKRIVFFESVY